MRRDLLHNLINAATVWEQKFMWAYDLLVGSEISWWFPNILPLESGLIGMVPKNPATRARMNRNGSHSSGSEISCDTGPPECACWREFAVQWGDRKNLKLRLWTQSLVQRYRLCHLCLDESLTENKIIFHSLVYELLVFEFVDLDSINGFPKAFYVTR